MYRAEDVNPSKWQNHTVLYDDETYSAIWGNYEGRQHKSLGVRWNGETGNSGYPSQGKYPLWYVEPELLTEAILRQLRTVVAAEYHSQESMRHYLPEIESALQEFRQSFHASLN